VTDLVWMWVFQGLLVVGVALWCRAAALRTVRAELSRWQDDLASLLEAACDRLESAPPREVAKAAALPRSPGKTSDPAAARLRKALAQRQATRR
jgi:hypothetical protein